jgi:hypothetical protein
VLQGTTTSATWSLPLPDNAARIGCEICSQRLVVDPARNPPGTSISDAAMSAVFI